MTAILVILAVLLVWLGAWAQGRKFPAPVIVDSERINDSKSGVRH